ncbi:TPA: hypothetical protein JD404_16420 [Citrobacter freundii]|nr:hypothetical protein [Citrobacter freundii]
MGGDESCTNYRTIDYARIMCLNDDGVETGYRDAMTPEQIQMYQSMQINQQIQMAQLNQQLQQTGQTFQNSGQQILQQSQSYQAPQVQSYSYGNNVNSYQKVGNTVIGSDGSSCQLAGQTMICR